MNIIIDPDAGCCPGVNRILKMAEQTLKEKALHSLGEIIHNHEEMERLKKKGLSVITDPSELEDNTGPVLIRAHGIPKQTYKLLEKKNIRVMDGTCPIVRRSERIAEEFSANGYQIIFVGKKGHAETISVTGHALSDAVIVEDLRDIEKIDFTRKSIIFAQTTVKESTFLKLVEKIKPLMKNELVIKNSICGFVKNRDKEIAEFAKKVDVLIMVGGKHSSNTKWLYSICRNNNPNSYWIESAHELNAEWFHNVKSVGITGSASTPRWQMEDVKNAIESL